MEHIGNRKDFWKLRAEILIRETFSHDEGTQWLEQPLDVLWVESSGDRNFWGESTAVFLQWTITFENVCRVHTNLLPCSVHGSPGAWDTCGATSKIAWAC